MREGRPQNATSALFGDRVRAMARAPGIRVKIAGIPMMLVIVVGVLLTFTAGYSTARLMENELRERGTAIARVTAGDIADLVPPDDAYALSRLVKRTRELNPDVSYVMVLDQAGAPIAHTFDSGIPEWLPEPVAPAEPAAPAAPAATAEGSQREIRTDEGLVLETSAPVSGGRADTDRADTDRADTVRVGMSEASLRAGVTKTTMTVLVVAAIAVIVALAAGFALAGLIARPVVDLVRATKAIGDKDLDTRPLQHTGDEIEHLTTSFNDMVSRLERSNRQLSRQHHDVKALNAVGAAASCRLNLDEVIAEAIRTAVSVFDAEEGWVLVGDGPWALSHCTVEGHELCTNPQEGCACLQVRSAAVSLAFAANGTTCDSLTALAAEAKIGTAWFIFVPLIAEGRQSGVIGLMFASRPTLADAPDLLTALGTQVGAAVANAELWAEIRQREEAGRILLRRVVTAQEEERKRVARELHDEIGQTLTSLGLGLRRLEEGTDSLDIRRYVAELRGVVGGALEGVSGLALALRPAALDKLGLVPALVDLAQRQGQSADIDIDVEAVGLDNSRLPHEVEVVLYRVVQEALTNVCRHSGARRASVLLQRRRDTVVAVVEDDGVGFDFAEIQRFGPDAAIGILGMQERADLVAGKVTVESVPGQGTSVYLTIPGAA